jgi:hypothetical protein
MRNLKTVLVIVTLLASQTMFANTLSTRRPIENRQCMVIAKACMSAGYTRRSGGNKHLWFSCMKPVLLGESVKGVKLNKQIVETCRDDKIKGLQSELNEFSSVK